MFRSLCSAAARRIILMAGAGLMLAACASLSAPVPPPTPAQVSMFGPLSNLVGKTWRSEPVDAAESGPADISAWSWDLGGRVLVNRHALEDGSYGGVTYVYENGQTGRLEYVYVTSGGFHTTGSFELGEDGSWTAEEAVTGHETITRVRSTGQINADGQMEMKSDYFSEGTWSPGRNVVYVPVEADVPEITGKLAE
jgi:hypothetical protein